MGWCLESGFEASILSDGSNFANLMRKVAQIFVIQDLDRKNGLLGGILDRARDVSLRARIKRIGADFRRLENSGPPAPMEVEKLARLPKSQKTHQLTKTI